MSFANRLDPSSSAFVPATSGQSDNINYAELFGPDFTASFPDISMNMNVDSCAPVAFAHSREHITPNNAAEHPQSAFSVPGITLEKVQMDMFTAFSSFMQLQSEYQAKIQTVEKELAKNVQEANSLRQDVDVLSDWAKAVLEYFGNEGTATEAKTEFKAQDTVV